MRILLANKYNFLKGGADKYFLELAEGLEARGHAVAKFCMSHPDNQPDGYGKFFVSQADYAAVGVVSGARKAGRIIWNFEAARKFDALLRAFRPDIIHIHNIYHQISPSILPVARKRGVPVVMHLDDYKLICPNYKLLRNGKICDACRGGRYCNAARYGCLKGSRLKSGIAAVEMHLHHNILNIYAKNIRKFIAPSQFMADTVKTWRPDIEDISILPYFMRKSGNSPRFVVGRDFIFVGRLSEEKGLKTMIKAWSMADIARQGNHKLLIVGSGPEQGAAEGLAGKLGLDGSVVFCGAKYGPELMAMIGRCRAMIVPSEWYEVLGIVNLEASLTGRPVIASDIGGIPEVVEDNKTGLLFQPGNAEELAAKIDRLARDATFAEELGRAGRQFVTERFDEDEHIKTLTSIYKSVMK